MATDKTRDCISALEHARAQIETALSGNADWLALRRAAPGSSPLAHGLAFAANPLYRSWKHLNEAIGDLQAALAERRSVAGPAPAPTEAQRPIVPAQVRSIELHHILRHIRDSAPQAGDRASPPHEAPTSAATATDDARGHGAAGAAPLQPEAHQAEAVDGAPDWEDMYVFAPEPEEASVTFVIRDEMPAASADGDAAHGEVEGGPLTDQWAVVGAEDCLYAPTRDEVEEAEVVIVSRPAERRSRKA